MFSSSTTDNINRFSSYPSSSSHFPPPTPLFINHESTNDILLYHHQDPLFSPLLPSTNAQNLPLNEDVINMAFSNNFTMPKLGVDTVLNGDYRGHSSFIIPSQRPTAKKDRHSKIYTAQGLRDRRVRLSIEIAREFFDLQDMLGFDKASKTLEWLLTKSRKAIKEVTKMKHKSIDGAKSLSSSSEFEEDGEDLEGIVSKSTTKSKEKNKMKKLRKAAFQLLGKESRAKARARARERTKEKICANNRLQQVSLLSQFEACEQKSGSNYNTNNLRSSLKVVAHEVDDEEPRFNYTQNNQATKGSGVFEKSILIKKKLKPTSLLAYQQNFNFAPPREVSCSYENYNNSINNINCVTNLPQNLDINGAISHSTFCAITNTNLSTGLQIHGKQWVAHNSQRLH